MRTFQALKQSFWSGARDGAAFSRTFPVATGGVDEAGDDLVELDILCGRNDCVIDNVT